MRLEKLVEVRTVTERFPTGEIKRTQYKEMRWVDIDQKLTTVGDEVLCAPSTSYDGPTCRRV